MGQTRKKKKQKLGRRLLTWWPSRLLIEFWVWSIATFMTLPGPRWAYFWARVMAHIGWVLLPGVRGVILRNIDLCLPELSEAERTRIGRESLKHNIYTFLDLLLVPRYFGGERWRDYAKRYGIDHALRVDADGKIQVTRALRDRLQFGEGITPSAVID